MQRSSLFLNKGDIEYRLSPTAVMSVLNHYQRREPDSLMVIGLLFGTKKK